MRFTTERPTPLPAKCASGCNREKGANTIELQVYRPQLRVGGLQVPGPLLDTLEQSRGLESQPARRDVLDQVISGHPNKIIAHELRLSQRSVAMHRSRVMEKMGARSVAQLVRMLVNVENRPDKQPN
jgi:DNA-binding CsgD family transcriptional regulator